MRDIRDDIDVIIDGIADTKGYIMDFTDVNTGAVNELFAQLGMFIITGYKIKIEGDHPDVGLYFQQVGGSVVVKAGKLAENTASKLVGMWPGSPSGTFKVIIKTQYTGSANKFSKELRIIESPFTLKK